MGIRFRRSLKLAPGIRMNLSTSGVSWTVGPRGASVNFGSRGTFLNAGIPGTGLSSRSSLSSKGAAPAALGPNQVRVQVRAEVEDDGTVRFLDSDGQPVSDYLVGQAKRQKGDDIRRMLGDICEKMNESRESLGKLHLFTPRSDDVPFASMKPYEVPRPERPAARKVGVLDWVLGRKDEVLAANELREQEFATAASSWEAEKQAWDAKEAEEVSKFSARLRSEPEFMSHVLEERLAGIVWPRETLVTLEVDEPGKALTMEVDLPEIEDLPHHEWSLPQRGYKLSKRNLTKASLNDLYSRHVHAIVFRILGEAFATLPTVETVVLSAFTQRRKPGIGTPNDTYILSVRADRYGWSQIDFGALDHLDVTTVLERFSLRRNIERNGSFGAIDPFREDDSAERHPSATE